MKIVLSAIILSGLFCLSSCFNRKEIVEIPDIRRAPEFVSETSLAFQGVPHPELAGRYSWAAGSVGPGKQPGTQRRQWRYVIPVTSVDWDRSAPVPFWISFHLTQENQDAQIGAFVQAIRAGQVAGQNVDFPARTMGALRGVSAWQQAVTDAEKRHGLRSDPYAPIVSWRP
jgi:hypothetical protein